MKINSLTCPNCSAKLEVMDGTDTFYCNYCGTKLVVEYREDVVEAKIAVEKMSHKERKADKKYEQKETMSKMDYGAKQSRRRYKFIFGIVIGSVVLCAASFVAFFAIVKENDKLMQDNVLMAQECVKEGDYAQARFYAGQIQASFNVLTWNAKRDSLLDYIDEKEAESRKAEIEGGEAVSVTVPMSADEIIGANRNDVYQILSDAGFINITMTELSESTYLFESGGGIKVVSIADTIEFEKGDTFLSTDEVILYYYKE